MGSPDEPEYRRKRIFADNANFQTTKEDGGEKVIRYLTVFKAIAIISALSSAIFCLNCRGQNHVEAFKSFLENPPVIKNLVVVQEWPQMKITNIFLLRWQSNAFLLAQANGGGVTELNLEKYSNPNAYPFVHSKYDNEYWSKRPNTIYQWIDGGDVEEKTNTVAHSIEVSLNSLKPLLNGGITAIDGVGQIVWSGESFAYTNKNRIIVSGKMVANNEGKVDSLALSIYNQRKKQSSKWLYAYAYSNAADHLSFYPAFIHATNGMLALTYKYYLLSTSAVALDRSYFLIDRTNYSDVSFIKKFENGNFVEQSYWVPPVVTPEENKQMEQLNRRRSALAMGFVLFSLGTLGVLVHLNRKTKH